jgi:transposase-like protein
VVAAWAYLQNVINNFFHPELYQIQPVFHLNSLVKNETFTLGINTERKFYRTLKLELQVVENLNEDYTLEFNIEKFNIDN